MNTIQKRSLHQLYSRPILFVGLLLLLAGAWCYTQMQTNLFPEVLFPRITVIADAGQQPVDRMMITVTKPLESAVKKVQGTTVVKSSTSRGSCVIDVYFKWGLDIYALKTQLESRINEIKGFLPDGTVISTEAMNQSLFPVYGFTLESKTHSRIVLRDVGNLVVRPMFSQVEWYQQCSGTRRQGEGVRREARCREDDGARHYSRTDKDRFRTDELCIGKRQRGGL